MNYIVKKICMNALGGAACMLGSWLTKYALDKTQKKINDQQKMLKEAGPVQ